MSVPYVIEYDDLDALIAGLQGNPSLSVDAQRLLLGAMLNRRNNDRSNAAAEVESLETLLTFSQDQWAAHERLRDMRSSDG